MILNWFKSISFAKWEHYKEACLWLIIIVIFGTSPVWIHMLLLMFYGSWTNYTVLLSRGELYIFTAAIISTSLYTLNHHFRNNSLSIASLLLLFLAAVLFSGTISKNILLSGQKIDITFLIKSSIAMSLMAILISFLARLAVYSKNDIELEEEIQKRVEKAEFNLREELSRQSEDFEEEFDQTDEQNDE